MLIKLIKSVKISNFSNIVLSSRNYSNNAVKLAYNVYEKNKNPEKNPLIVLHGLFGSKSNWNSLSKAFDVKTGRRIISIDARNHGESPHTEEHNYPAMSKDVAQLYSDLGLQKANVLGHSMGGRCMMLFALEYPHLVEKLIVVDISPVSPIGSSQTDIPLFLKAMKSIALEKSLTIHQARKVADQELSKIINDQSLRNFLITNLAKSDAGEFSWRINLNTLEREFDGNINKFPDCSQVQFSGPTLFIGGERSDYIKKDDFPKIKTIFPNSELVYVKNAGHWVHSEKPEEFMNLVLEFLEK